MVKARMAWTLTTGCLAVWGSLTPAQAAAPSVADVLKFRPKQEAVGVTYTIPTAQEEGACKLEVVKGTGRSSGWILKDPNGLTLRRFFDNDGDGNVDSWSYYKEGIETYRDMATGKSPKANEFRWLNEGGTKWGVDLTGDGKIDTWKIISAEEVCHEIVQTLVSKDYTRLQALLITDAELKALELPANEVTRIQALRTRALTKLEATRTKLTGFSEKTRLMHIDITPPACVPAEQIGAKYDLIKHNSISIICGAGETGANAKTDWVRTGEMIQVGAAWRLVEGPSDGPPGGQNDQPEVADAELKDLEKQLAEWDSKASGTVDLMAYHLGRVDLLEKLVNKVKPQYREPRIREMADSLAAASQANTANDVPYNRLTSLRDQLVKAMAPGHPLCSYVTYREMEADYARKLAKDPKGIEKTQAERLEKLQTFLQTYSKADDAPEALLQAAMVSEFAGKEGEAKKWYQQLQSNFEGKPQANKAKGALARLNLEGQTLELKSPQLGSGAAFDINQLRGKVVLVYYWASWNQQSFGDYDRIKQLLEKHGSKGLEVVGVNLDNSAKEASEFLKRTNAPGVQLFNTAEGQNGLDSALGAQYGIMVLPQLFVVDKAGKVTNTHLQVGNVEDEVLKLLK